MFYLKTINETLYRRKPVYLQQRDLKNGIIYCCKEDPDDVKYEEMDLSGINLSGCSNIFSNGSIEDQLDIVYHMIINLNDIYRPDKKPLLKHRIVSFNKNDLLSVQEIGFIAECIIDWYALKGFTGIYGIHYDTDNPHIHFQIGSVSYVNGNRMHIDFEKIMLFKLIGHWYIEFYNRLLNDPDELYNRITSSSFFSEFSYDEAYAKAVNIISNNLSWVSNQLLKYQNISNVYPLGIGYNF